MTDTVPKAEYDKLAAKHARLVEAARGFVGINDCVCGDESACCYHSDKDELGRVVVALRALLRDEPETPKGEGSDPASPAPRFPTLNPDRLALAMEVVKEATCILDLLPPSNPADRLRDALARFEASDGE